MPPKTMFEEEVFVSEEEEECFATLIYKLRYQQQLAKRDALIKSTQELDEDIAKIQAKKRVLVSQLLSGLVMYINTYKKTV